MNYHDFVDLELQNRRFVIKNITENYMIENLDEIMNFVNNVMIEFQNNYGWEPLGREYFLNPLDRKWDFSQSIVSIKDQSICAIYLTSVYGSNIHHHCSYTRKDLRGFNLSKLHMIKLCQLGLDSGYTNSEAYFPKNNNGSLILHLKMGWKIEDIRKNGSQIFMVGDLLEIRNKTYSLLPE